MLSSLARRIITLTLTHSLLCSVVFTQQQTKGESRPRRVQSEWPQPPTSTVTIPTPVLTSIAGPEPKIRVALSTDAKSATISTTSQLMNASGNGNTLLALDTSRVRVEPRLLSPLPQSNIELYRVVVAGAASRAEAEDSEKEIEKIANEDTQVMFDTETKTWGLVVGSKQPKEEADELQARLEEAGIDANITPIKRENGDDTGEQKQAIASSTNQPQSGIRLANKISFPSREVVASSATNARLLSSSAPVSFASDDELQAPVRYNERPYRGRIEVFTNLRGSLTVVNELGLEDYVRGVVANELSPGGYPAIEALKAQAVAARTYALKNRGQFMAQGFDLLPTTRSQVYRGLTSENPLSTRAVDETRGIIATYAGEPINALYTSTCGGRTENSENIFNDAIPYLRGRECAAEGTAAFTTFTVKTNRAPIDLRSENHLAAARDVGLLSVQNVNTFPRLTDSWLADEIDANEVRNLLANVARIARQPMAPVGEDINRPGPFATALLTTVVGESRSSTLMNDADADYLLPVRDADEIPAQNRADLAMLVRDGFLSIYPDATLRPKDRLSRARVIHAIVKLLETRNLLQLQKGTARPTAEGQLILRTTRGKDQIIKINPDAFLFRQIGDNLYSVRSIALVGGEPVMFHLGPNGLIDYLEVKPAPNGAAADRFSPFSNWTKELSPRQVQARLARSARGIGQLIDLRVLNRGYSHRVTDLEVVGTSGTAHVRGGRIRSALGLKEQLFVIDREYDDYGNVASFVFRGRGWGHGVGMCQVGAYGLAKQGWSYEQILKAYYTGIDLTKMY